jgi:hypothetical protein
MGSRTTVVRVIVGIVVTILLLGVARVTSTRRSRELAVESEGIRIVHDTVTEQVGPGEPVISALIVTDRIIEPRLIYKIGDDEGEAERINMLHMGENRWEARLPSLTKGTKIYYGFVVLLDDGTTVMLPGERDDFPVLKYKGKASPIVLGLHIIFMFGAFYFMIQSLWSAIALINTGEGKRETVSNARWVFFLTLIGGWPLGFILNYQAFGVIWEGYPFGYDITDNKTQVIFIFWLVSLLLVRGSFLANNEEKDLLGPRGFAIAVLISFVVSLFLYIVPHSL